MELTEKKYCIAVIDNFKRYFDFKKKCFDFDCFEHNRNKNHFISDIERAKKTANKLHKLEQSRKYPFAKTIYLYENDFIINYINNN